MTVSLGATMHRVSTSGLLHQIFRLHFTHKTHASLQQVAFALAQEIADGSISFFVFFNFRRKILYRLPGYLHIVHIFYIRMYTATVMTYIVNEGMCRVERQATSQEYGRIPAYGP